MLHHKTKIPEELQIQAYTKFTALPLESKLIIYARLTHGNMFKAQNNDLLGLNRRLVSKIYRSFIDSLKEDCDDRTYKTSTSHLESDE